MSDMTNDAEADIDDLVLGGEVSAGQWWIYPWLDPAHPSKIMDIADGVAVLSPQGWKSGKRVGCVDVDVHALVMDGRRVAHAYSR